MSAHEREMGAVPREADGEGGAVDSILETVPLRERF